MLSYSINHSILTIHLEQGGLFMNLSLDRPIAFIDLETTGLNPTFDRIVELSALKVHPDGSEEVKSVRVNPEMPISAGATRVHGIKDSDVAREPTFRQYAKNLMAFLDGCDLSGFNAIRFDLPMLRAEFARVGMQFDVENRKVVDPMVIFHQMEPRDLGAAYSKYCGKTLDGAAHTSAGDVRAAMEVLDAQVRYYPDLGSSMASLHEMCHPKELDWIDDEGKVITTDNGPALGFGKYRGRLLKDIVKLDGEYLNWVIYEGDFTEQVKQVVREAVKP
jgi:DNA polymerase-3 subunit epsilon